MLQFIETICYENGGFQRVFLHEERMNRTRQDFFGLKDRLSLEEALAVSLVGLPAGSMAGFPAGSPLSSFAIADLKSVSTGSLVGSSAGSSTAEVDSQTAPTQTLVQKIKCRVTYSKTIESIEFESYMPRVIQSLQLVYDDNIDYSYKFKDRSALNTLLNKRGASDEILIVKNRLVTDTSYSNIVFLREGKWHTPEAPLLSGTRRTDYLHMKLIFPLDISLEEIGQFEEARLINAMLSLEEATPIKIENIFL